jgi:hypothetical protein
VRRFRSAVLGLLAVRLLACLSAAYGQDGTEPAENPAPASASWSGYPATADPNLQAGANRVTRLPTMEGTSPLLTPIEPIALCQPVPASAGELFRLPAICDECPTHALVAFVGYDSWRGVADGSWQHNGISTGLNYGTRLGQFSELTGIGFQVGGSVGAYNWLGTNYTPTDNNAAQTQGFVTYGFFRKATENSKWSGAVVQDWMFNDNFGQYALNPTLSQWRGQIGYVTSAANEFGVWGTLRGMGDSRMVPGEGPTSFRAIDQLNFFWHHKWGFRGADTSLWVGVPQRTRLTGDASLGDYLVGVSASLPLNDRIAVYNLLTYMHPSAHPGPVGADEDAWNFTIGLAFYPARNARTNTVAGQCWTPQMPVANNGYFLVDTNRL